MLRSRCAHARQVVREEGSLLHAEIAFEVGSDVRPSTKWYREQPELVDGDEQLEQQLPRSIGADATTRISHRRGRVSVTVQAASVAAAAAAVQAEQLQVLTDVDGPELLFATQHGGGGADDDDDDDCEEEEEQQQQHAGARPHAPGSPMDADEAEQVCALAESHATRRTHARTHASAARACADGAQGRD
eukprot:scaffold2321_cov329-Prasinococcus_capsulatus_cf.AAC.9